MAIVTRYFSTEAAGSEDGTSWADRAALLSSGNWSSVITGFNFSGSDSLKCLIGPGTYNFSQTFTSALFTNPPTVSNPLIFHGCDGSGVQLSPSNSDWVSAEVVDWGSGLPTLATASNSHTINLANTFFRLLKVTASSHTSNSVINSLREIDWCIVECSSAITSTTGVVASITIRNSYIEATNATYSALMSSAQVYNTRAKGNATASGGNRYGWASATATVGPIINCTIFDNPGGNIVSTASSTAFSIRVFNTVIANSSGSGILLPSTASQTAISNVGRCVITGNGAFGIDTQSATRVACMNSRLRNNTSGNFNGFGNYPTDLDNDTSSGSDSDEYVNAAGGDYRIKFGSALWGKGYGAGDAPPDPEAIATAVWAREGRSLTS